MYGGDEDDYEDLMDDILDEHRDFIDEFDILEDDETELRDEVDRVAEPYATPNSPRYLEGVDTVYDNPFFSGFQSSLSDFLEEGEETQRFHYEEVRDAYRNGDDFSLTVLLSTFFESYLSTQLAGFVEMNPQTLLEPEDITGGEDKKGGMMFGELIEYSEKAGLFQSEAEKEVMDIVRSSRNALVHEPEKFLGETNPTDLQYNDLIEPAIQLYESKIDIDSDNSITNLERDSLDLGDDPWECQINAIEYSAENGSEAATSILLNAFFKQYLLEQVDKPGYGTEHPKMPSRDRSEVDFDRLLEDYRKMHYGEEFHEEFETENFTIDHQVQIFTKINQARKRYSHDLATFAEGNGLKQRNYEAAIDLFHELAPQLKTQDYKSE